MNKNKTCPRCKQPTLTKNSKNNSFLCSTCKYISKSMHIVAQAQNQYGMQHKFWLKIKDKKEDDNLIKNALNDSLQNIEQSEKKVVQLCIKQYQKLLRKSLDKLFIHSDHNMLSKKAEVLASAKQIWSSYLTLIAKDKGQSHGIFTKCINKWKQKVLNKNNKFKLNQSNDIEKKNEEIAMTEKQQKEHQKIQSKEKQPNSSQKLKKRRRSKAKQQEKPQLSVKGFRHLLIALQKSMQTKQRQKSNNRSRSKSKAKGKSQSKKKENERKKKGFSIGEIIKQKQENSIRILSWTLQAFLRSTKSIETQQLLIKIALKYAQILFQIDELKQMQKNNMLSLNYFSKKQSYFSGKNIDEILQKKDIINLKVNHIGQDLTFSSEEDRKLFTQKISWKKQFKLLILFLQGFLRYVLKDKIEDHMNLNFEELMGFYHLVKNYLKQQAEFIDVLLKLLMKYLNNQTSKKEIPKTPKISYSLIYAIGYLAILSNQIPITLNQLISRIGFIQLSKQTLNQTILQEKIQFIYIEHKQTISTEKIRKKAMKLFNYLYSHDKMSIPAANISQWIQLYCKEKNLLELKSKAQTLYKIFVQHEEVYKPYHMKLLVKGKQHKDTYLDQRHLFLEQDVHAVTIIFIVIKIYYGFGMDQHLINIDSKLLEAVFSYNNQPGFQIYQNTLQKLREYPQLLPSYMHQKIQIQEIMKRLYCSNLQISEPFLQLRKYTDIQNMTWKTYEKAFNFSQRQITLVRSGTSNKKKIKKTDFITLETVEQQKEPLTFSQSIQKQIQVIHKECIEKNQSEIPSYLLQHPAENYEIYHDYQSFSQCLNRDKMTYLLEQLIGNSYQQEKTYQILNWYEKILTFYQRRNK